MAWLSTDELQEYCTMLPLAYYAGRAIKVEASNETLSSANVVNDVIYISRSQVNNVLRQLDHVDPSVIRSLVYHEVSHVILTPRQFYNATREVCWRNQKYAAFQSNPKFKQIETNVFWLCNAFEDERIECLMRNTYMDVNFYDNNCKINKWTKPHLADNVNNVFFEVIRMHEISCKGFNWRKYYNRSRQLILKWSMLQPNSSLNDVAAYCNDIFDLYYDFVTEAVDAGIFDKIAKQKRIAARSARAAKQIFKEPEDEAKPTIIPANDDPKKPEEEEEEEEEEEPEKKEEEKQNDRPDIDIEEDDDDEDENEGDQPDLQSCIPSLDIAQTRSLFKSHVFEMQDEKVKQLLEQKFFIKDMHGMQMGAIHKHSGKLDVKAVGRKDWKIFKQPSVFSDGSKIGKKMHLILVLDQSGSYSHNDYSTNLILASLTSAERKLAAFEFTLLKFGTGFHVCSKSERFSNSHEGTEFSVKLFDQIKLLKRQDYANFVIFLNDGAAWVSGYEDKRTVIASMRKALDHDNCICILDNDAYYSWFRQIKNAKVIVTDDYVKSLSDNVCEALGAMLAV